MPPRVEDLRHAGRVPVFAVTLNFLKAHSSQLRHSKSKKLRKSLRLRILSNYSKSFFRIKQLLSAMSTLENDAWMEPIYYYSTYFLTALTIGMTLLVFFHSPAAKWLELKRYQYEVTMGLHMMTPTERFIVSTSRQLPAAKSN